VTVAAPHLAHSRWQRWSTDMQIVVTELESLRTARREVDAELDLVEAAASRFRPDSEIVALANSAGQPTPVSAILANLLDAALTAAALTGGDVDPTVGATLVALGYDRDVTALGSGEPLVSSILAPAVWSMVTLDGGVVTVPPGVLLDLGATAKAVAADQCAARVHAVTGSGVLINLGGDIATAGPAPEGGWQVGVHDGDGEPQTSLTLPGGTALATSSTLRRRWRRGHDLLHHIVNPHTGLPADPVWRTVSVAAHTCFAANTVTTAAVVRGRRALDWIASLGMSGWLVDRDGHVHTVGGWPPAIEEPRR
jgi:thiamine biosynthesis lipoprotein